MRHQVSVSKIQDSKRFRTSGLVLGVAQAKDGVLWLELGASTPGIPPMILSIRQNGALWNVTHKCSTLNGGKMCWHVPAAIEIAHEVVGLRRMTTGNYEVDVSLAHPMTPAGPLTDLTVKVEGHAYNGTKLLPVLVADPTASAPAPAAPAPTAARSSSSGAPAAAAASAPSTPAAPAGYGVSLLLDPEAEKVARYLEAEGVSKAIITEVLKLRRKDVPAQYADRVPKGSRFTGLKAELELALVCFLLEKNLMAVGPKSSGKTTLVDTLAWIFNLPLFTINGSLQTEVADMRGDRTLEVDPESKAAFVKYVLGTITEAMQVGGIGYVDEFPNIREGIAVWLNGLDWRKAVEVPGYGVVKAHPAFRLALSGNKGYAGCATPNEATVDRTTIIEMPYAEKIAPIITQESRNKDKATATKLEQFFKRTRLMIENKEIRTAAPLTVRGLIDAADYMSMGIPGKIALRSCVLAKIWDADYPKDREKVAQVIDAMFA